MKSFLFIYLAAFKRACFNRARALLNFALVFSIFFPASFQSMASQQGSISFSSTAANLDSPEAQILKSDAEKFDRLDSLSSMIQELTVKNPQDPAIKVKQDEANMLAIELMKDVVEKSAPIEAELAPLREKLTKGSPSAEEKTKYAQLRDQSVPLEQRKKQLMQMAGAGGLDIPFELNLSSEQIIGGISLDANSHDENVERVVPGSRKSEGLLSKLSGGPVHFSTQYFTFSVSMGIIALAQLQFLNVTDPNAIENWEKQTFSLLGAEGFAAFMATNHVTVKMLQRVRRGTLPPSLINYIGMTAGSIASSAFTEFWTDKDVWACIKPYYDSKAKVKQGACEKTYTTWMIHNKIMQYAPSVVSMIGSTAMAQAIRSQIGKLKAVQNFDKSYVKVVVRGMRVATKSRAATRAAVAIGRTALGASVATADFVLFLALDAYVTSTPINNFYQRTRAVYDPVAWANKLGLHSEFFWPKENQFQPIANTFDVTATTPYSSHQFLMNFYRQMQATGWKKPESIEACVPTSIKAEKQAVGKEDNSNKWFFQKWMMQKDRMKSGDQLACEVYARPTDLMDRYSEKSHEWRETILTRFRTSQSNWINMISQFSTMYEASYILGNHLSTEKVNVTLKGAQKPDLSRTTLAKLIKAPLPSEDASEGQEESVKLNSWFLDGTSLPTPELIDYVAAGFACGPDPVLKTDVAGRTAVQRAYDNVAAMIGSNVVSPTYMTTPYGSSLHFTPPKLTSKSRAICENAKRSLYATLNYMTGNYLSEGKSDHVNENPFVGPFRDEDGKQYPSLVDFAFENLSEEVYHPIGNFTGFANWWTAHFTNVIAPVWKNYQVKYDEFISKYYVPVLFDRTYSAGCRADDQPVVKTNDKVDSDGLLKDATCTADSSAYRVSEGVFLAIETEMRNYLRGLFSLYMSTVQKGDDAKARKAAFMEIANQIISDIRIVSPESIKEKDFGSQLDEAQKNVDELIELVAVRLNSLPESPDNQFRKKMLEKFNSVMAKIIEDERHHGETFQAFSFQGGAPMRAAGENLNSARAANPLLRRGG